MYKSEKLEIKGLYKMAERSYKKMNGWIIGFSIGLILGSIIFNTYFYRKLKRDREEMTKKIIQDFREWIAKGDKNEVRKDSNI